MEIRKLYAIMRKEFRHILRDSRSLTVVFILPLLMIFLYGHALSFDLGIIRLGVINLSESESAQGFLESLKNDPLISLHSIALGSQDPWRDAESLIRQGRLDGYLVLPQDFTSSPRGGRTREMALVLDGSDANTVVLIQQQLESLRLDFLQSLSRYDGESVPQIRLFFNPGQKSSFFIVPGMVAVLLMMIASMLTSSSIAREKESGSIRLLFISPISTTEILLGKTLPYLLVAFASGGLVMTGAHLIFGIPYGGGVMALLLFVVLYTICGLALGILISVVSATQRMALILCILTTMLPAILLSGFLIPTESMSPIIRFCADLVPATHFLPILRGLIIKGAGMGEFVAQAGVLSLMSLGLLVLSWWRFQALRRCP